MARSPSTWSISIRCRSSKSLPADGANCSCRGARCRDGTSNAHLYWEHRALRNATSGRERRLMQSANLKGTVGVEDAPCRHATPEEVAHYQEFGWEKLKGFVRADLGKLILSCALDRMGEDADSNA